MNPTTQGSSLVSTYGIYDQNGVPKTLWTGLQPAEEVIRQAFSRNRGWFFVLLPPRHHPGSRVQKSATTVEEMPPFETVADKAKVI